MSVYDTFSIDNLDTMFDFGLFIHDFSMHGASRDIAILGGQQSKELTSALQKVGFITYRYDLQWMKYF